MDPAMAPRRAAALRLGGAMLTLGALAWLILSGLHGDLPPTGAIVLIEAVSPRWPLIHILTIIAIATVAAGAALVTGTLMDPWAFAVGRAGTMMAVPSGAVLGVGFALDGHVLPGLAHQYAATSDEAMQRELLMRADAALMMIGATSLSFQTLFGLAVVVLALATLISREYPRWLGAVGVVGGATWASAGFVSFIQGAVPASWLFLVPVAPVAVWMVGIGGLAWRRGLTLARTTESSHPLLPMTARPEQVS